MDMCRLSAVLALLFAALCVVTSGMSLPSNDLENAAVELDDSDNGMKDEARRASWLETRDIEEDFKNLVLLTLRELVNDGKLNQDLLVDESNGIKEKRGRWQGFCFRRTKTGRFLPYICWKGDRK